LASVNPEYLHYLRPILVAASIKFITSITGLFFIFPYQSPSWATLIQDTTSTYATMQSLFKAKHLLPISLNLLAIGGSTFYLRSKIDYNLEEQEARLDEIEGTLRGHIGLIEDALDRIEGKENGNKMEELYSKRGRDEKK
jgi:hypothetical protein